MKNDKQIKWSFWKIVVWLLLCFPFFIFAQSPCTLQNKNIIRQSQLDSIPLLYPGCEYIDEINIIGKNINDLSSLNFIKRINSIVIRGTLIKSLKGLDSLNYCKNLDMISNDSLENILALKRLKALYSTSILNNNNLISYDGLESDSIEIILDKNNKCTSLRGIKSKIVTALAIYNPSLETYSGHGIKFVNYMQINFPKHIDGIGSFDVQRLEIIQSDFLEDIDPVDSLQNLVRLHLFGNKNLNMCSIDLVCRNLNNPGFDLQLFSNAPGCNTKAEIRQKCISSTNQNETENELSLFPNPVQESLRISGLKEDVSFSIHNNAGLLVQKGGTSGDVDVSGLPQGMYIMTLTGANSGDKTVFRFVKM